MKGGSVHGQLCSQRTTSVNDAATAIQAINDISIRIPTALGSVEKTETRRRSTLAKRDVMAAPEDLAIVGVAVLGPDREANCGRQQLPPRPVDQETRLRDNRSGR